MKLMIAMLIISFSFSFAQEIPSKKDQIGAAVMAAPKEFREGATVMGYNEKGELVTLREGTNHLICLADDPNKEGFSVAAYHKDLEPFMARGRELRAQEKSREEVFKIRKEEAKSGKLKMPERGATLHVLSGPEGKYDPKTGKVLYAHYRSVVYIPWATTETTGLPTSPAVPGGPWIMNPGTHRAHIMITPPADSAK